jgi:hypothetical protein
MPVAPETVKARAAAVASSAQQVQDLQGRIAPVEKTRNALVDLQGALREAAAVSAPVIARRQRVARLEALRDALRAGRAT